MVFTFLRIDGNVANYSNLSLAKRLYSKWGSSPKFAKIKAFTGFDRGSQVLTKCNSK